MTHFQDVTPDPRKGPDDDEEDREQRSQGRHRSGSVWSRVGGRSSSRSREPVGSERQVYTQDSRGRQWARAPSEGRSRSYRSRSPSEVRPPPTTQEEVQDPQLSQPSPQVPSPCKNAQPRRSGSPDAGANFTATHFSSSSPHDVQPELLIFSQGQVLDMLEKHLDPMLHEATIQHSMYSPDTTSPRVASPVFIPSSAQEIVVGAAAEMPPGARNLNELVAGLPTPVQAALLPTPDMSSRRPCRNKVILHSPQRHSERLACKRRFGTKIENFAQEILAKNFGFLNDQNPF